MEGSVSQQLTESTHLLATFNGERVLMRVATPSDFSRRGLERLNVNTALTRTREKPHKKMSGFLTRQFGTCPRSRRASPWLPVFGFRPARFDLKSHTKTYSALVKIE